MGHKPLPSVLAVSEHMGQGQAMPQQGIVQNADKNAGKGEQDQADLEASTKQNHNYLTGTDKTVPHKPFNEMNIKKLTRAEKGELVDRVLQVTSCIALFPGHADQCLSCFVLCHSLALNGSQAVTPGTHALQC